MRVQRAYRQRLKPTCFYAKPVSSIALMRLPSGGVCPLEWCLGPSSIDDLVLGVKILIHFSDLHILNRLTDILLGIGLGRSSEQRVGELEGDNTSTLVTHKNDGVDVVEGDVVGLCALRGRLHVAQVLVLVLVQIVDVEFAFVGDGGEDR